MGKPFTFKLAAAVILPFMLFFIAPLTFYFSNVNDIDFSLTEVILPVTGVFLALSFTFFLILYFTWYLPKCFYIITGLLVGLAAMVWVQSQLFLWKFGVFDGRDIDWNKWRFIGWIEIVVWLLVVTLMVVLYYKGKEKSKKLIVQVLFLLGVISVTSSFLTRPTKIQRLKTLNKYEDFFSFHKTNNILIILLDTFQSDYFDLIREEYPKEINFLDGFTFYRNTMSHYPSTEPNIPAIVSGRLYKNQEKFNDFFRDSVARFDLQSYYQKKGYSAMMSSVTPMYLLMTDLLKGSSVDLVAPVYKYIDYGVFRCSPTLIKKLVYNNGSWLLSFKKAIKYPPDPFGNDIRFVDLFEKQANINREAKAGTFKFIHFFLPHPPWCMDENLKYNPKLTGKEGYIHQTRGALKLAKRILTKLRELNLYENSEIVIMADHGTTGAPALRTETGLTPTKVQSSALALFLHKPPFAKGKLVLDDSPLYNSDLGCLLKVENKHLDYAGYNAAKKGENRQRTFLYYDWNDDWGRDFIPDMTEYIVSGHAFKSENWRMGYYIYTPKGKVDISSTYQYNIGTPIKFVFEGNANQYILGGWSHQEKKHRWTEGKIAGLHFTLVKPPKSNLVLWLKGYGYTVNGKIDHQNVNVLINGRKVASWKMKEDRWYNADILKSMIVDRVNNIVFEISNPAAPEDFGQSNDRRKLGIAVRELVIIEKK